MYADDLVLQGDTRQGELDFLLHILKQFDQASGLQMNPDKSKVWFSRSCGEGAVEKATHALQAAIAVEEEKYLGAMIQGGNTGMKTGMILLDRMMSKLAGWTAHMLSHADRLVLIKSVLMSLPVYYMTVECVPRTISKKMNSLLARFFWGRIGQDKYLAPKAWKTICKPIDQGGLGVRELQSFGDALFLKLVWALISEERRLWV